MLAKGVKITILQDGALCAPVSKGDIVEFIRTVSGQVNSFEYKTSSGDTWFGNFSAGYFSVQSRCCPGEPSVWDNAVNLWRCTRCTQIDSTSTVLTNTSKSGQTELFQPMKSSCECGSTKLGSDRHSSWCPVWTKNG